MDLNTIVEIGDGEIRCGDRTVLANALKDATGIRFASLPLSADRIFSKLAENKT